VTFEGSQLDASSAKRVSVLHSFRSRSNSRDQSKADLSNSLDPELLAFQQRASRIVSDLMSAEELRIAAYSASEASQVLPLESDGSSDEYKEVLQAHCAETLDSFGAEMEQKMQDCLRHCQNALVRRKGPLSEMKSKLRCVHPLFCRENTSIFQIYNAGYV
jgi:hypothetical protein